MKPENGYQYPKTTKKDFFTFALFILSLPSLSTIPFLLNPFFLSCPFPPFLLLPSIIYPHIPLTPICWQDCTAVQTIARTGADCPSSNLIPCSVWYLMPPALAAPSVNRVIPNVRFHQATVVGKALEIRRTMG